MKRIILALALIASTTLVAGCGGGGGESVPVPTSNVTLSVKTTGTSAPLYGLQFKMALPAGVTLATLPSGELVSGVVVPSAAEMVATYDRSSTPQTLAVSAISETGFPSGDLIAVTVSVPGNVSVAAGSFALSDFAAYADLTGVPATDVTISVSIP